ncbi:hypothetical protein G9P44_005195 [Scheffersomyces stipitis]|nr:hypothetical protein G9P44_005195 [Scheffersomyces stipitis]
MTELNIDLHSLPDHCVQFILDLLSFRVLQSLASNGTSPFQTKILRSIYKVVDIGYGYNRKLDLEYLKSHELFGSRNEISAQLKSCQAFQQLLDSNRQIRVQEVRIMSVPAPRFIPNLHELDSVERIFVNLANLDNFRKGERNALRYLPDNVYMVVTDYYPEMLFPQNLRKLELSLWDAMTVENLPPRLQFLSIAQRSGEPSMSLQQLGRLPQTLKHLILLNCIDMSHEDGECKLDLPLSLCALKISTGYSGNACLDISHLKNLQRFSVYLPVLPLSFFKLPPSILKLCYESERGLSCSEQISKLSLLNNVQLQLGNVTSKIRFSNSVNNVCLKSGRFGSKPVGDCIELPEQLKFLEFQNCSGLRLTSNHAYMTSLTIFSCKVISLPVIDSLKTLKIINLRNQIKFWDTIDKYFPELLWLEVENSQLESVPSIPCQLETLILDHNLIQEFHLRVPPSLTSISMVSNILKTFIVSGPSNLKKIDIQMNRFSELSHSRLQLPFQSFVNWT